MTKNRTRHVAAAECRREVGPNQDCKQSDCDYHPEVIFLKHSAPVKPFSCPDSQASLDTTMALLQRLIHGRKEIEDGRVIPAADVFAQLEKMDRDVSDCAEP